MVQSDLFLWTNPQLRLSCHISDLLIHSCSHRELSWSGISHDSADLAGNSSSSSSSPVRTPSTLTLPSPPLPSLKNHTVPPAFLSLLFISFEFFLALPLFAISAPPFVSGAASQRDRRRFLQPEEATELERKWARWLVHIAARIRPQRHFYNSRVVRA